MSGLSHEHRQALAKLAALPEFKALEALFKVEENNIVLSSFKINSGDPSLNVKKAHHEGRLNELKRILKTFSEAKKSGE